jgi:cobalt-zinc-cadmium efflux system protein
MSDDKRPGPLPLGSSHSNERNHHSQRKEAKLRVAMWLNVAIVGVQIVFGVVAHSLGLIADAGHNLTDFAAVLASMIAIRFARQPATRQRSFGFHRATVLAAQANAVSILVITALVSFEAIRRIIHPTEVNGPIVIAVALGAAAANLVAALVLRDPHDHSHGHQLDIEPERFNRDHDHDHDHDLDHGGDGRAHAEHDHDAHDHGKAGASTHSEDLNMRSAMLHMAGDAVASLGVALSGIIITVTGGWYWLDPVASIAIGLIIAVQAWKLLRRTVDVLLESTPEGLDTHELTSVLAGIDGVEDVHDLHVWALASDVRAMSAHLVLEGSPSLEQAQQVAFNAKAAISRRFAITHATLELEGETCRDDGTWCALDR